MFGSAVSLDSILFLKTILGVIALFMLILEP